MLAAPAADTALRTVYNCLRQQEFLVRDCGAGAFLVGVDLQYIPER